MTVLLALAGILVPLGTIILAIIVLKSTKRKAVAEADTAELKAVDSLRRMLNEQTDRVNAEMARMETRVAYVEDTNVFLRTELGSLRDDNTMKTARINTLESENRSKDRRITTLETILRANGLTIPPQQNIGEPQS